MQVEQRLSVAKLQHEAYRALAQADAAAERSLDASLYHLVKMRASQINGCAFCLDMHSKDARRGGETEQRLYALNAWSETNFYSDAERAALAYTEAATRVAETHVPDAVYAELERHFDAEQIAALIMAVALINAWNRISISSRTPAGSYRPEEAR